MAVYKRGSIYWYKFTWNGEPIRESTKQGNKRVAEQIESAHKTSLAKGEVGIRVRVPIAILKDFIEHDFTPFIESRFQDKPKTLEYYRNGIKNIAAFACLATSPLDKINIPKISAFIASRRNAGLQVASINRQLEVLRRMLKLAVEWGKVEKAMPKIEILPGENHRDRVLSCEEEVRYFKAATGIGEELEKAYRRALVGIRATMRGEQPKPPDDSYVLRDVGAILIDCGLRPDECFRLRWENVRDRAFHIPFGKTQNARRIIPLTPRVEALIEMRRTAAKTPWVFPSQTRSGHMEKSTLKKQHPKACKAANVTPFDLYTFRHTCLTRWAEYMDPYTLAYSAGHSDFATTRRYVHPQAETVRAAMERARNGQGGHKTGHSAKNDDEGRQPSIAAIQ